MNLWHQRLMSVPSAVPKPVMESRMARREHGPILRGSVACPPLEPIKAKPLTRFRTEETESTEEDGRGVLSAGFVSSVRTQAAASRKTPGRDKSGRKHPVRGALPA